jgi:hypothetical protein
MDLGPNFIVGLTITCVFIAGVGGYCIWKMCKQRTHAAAAAADRPAATHPLPPGWHPLTVQDEFGEHVVEGVVITDSDDDDDTVLFSSH